MSADPKSDIAIAGGVVAIDLLDTLVRKGVIDRGTGMQILGDAQQRCIGLGQMGAAKVIGDAYSKMRSGG